MNPVATHTPGPWVVRPLTGFVRTMDGRAIAAPYGAREDGSLDDVLLSNAHLIAAAPELLAALQGAVGALEYSVDCVRDDGNNSDIDFAQSKLDAALNALAKARGEANG